MKSFIYITIISVIGLCNLLYGQQTGRVQVQWGAEKTPRSRAKMSADEFRLMTLKHILESGSSPLTVGNAQLHRAGDQAAVDLIKIIGVRKPLNETETLTLIEMLRKAFERPAAILAGSDRTPKATLFLLQSLESTIDPNVRQRIVEARQAILDSVDKP